MHGRARADGQHLGDARSISARSTTASISSIQAGTKYIGGHSDVMLGTVVGQRSDRGRAARHRRAPWACASAPTTCISACAACARWRCGSTGTTSPGSPSRAGWRSGRRSCACCIRRSQAIPATRSGSAISPAHRACSASCSSRCRRQAVYAFLDALELFGIGASWGGYESLAIPFDCAPTAHRDALGAGRPDGALPHRSRRRRRPHRRSRTRLRRACRAAARRIDAQSR